MKLRVHKVNIILLVQIKFTRNKDKMMQSVQKDLMHKLYLKKKNLKKKKMISIK